MAKQTEKPFYRYSRFWKYSVMGIWIGWLGKTYFPDKNGLEVFGEAWEVILNSINALGGTTVVVGAIIAIVSMLRKKNNEKTVKRNT